MKKLLLILILTACCLRGAPIKDQYPSTGDELLAGCKLWLAVQAHDCSKGDCDHFSKEDALRAVATFTYMKGFVYGVRTSQAISKTRIVNLPDEGVDCSLLVQPLIVFLEKDAELRSQHISLGIYVFLMKRYPAK